MTVLSQIVEQARAQSPAEVVAVVSAVAYLVLAIRQNIACWFFAAISTAIYIWLFIVAKLYMESVLNGFYLAMAVYGWFVWRSGKDASGTRPVTVWPLQRHIIALLFIALVALLNGFALNTWTDAAYPYIDSLTTWSAIWATFLVARKVLENWWYWLVIDAASVAIYWSRDLQLTSLLFVLYLVMIPFGLKAWTESLRRQESGEPA